MTTTTVSAFEHTVHATNEWLSDLNRELGRDDPQQAYRILRAVLMALRDRLTVEEATDLGAQLPMLVRGFYYEGWNPSKTPSTERDRASFLARISRDLVEPSDGDPEKNAQAVFHVLSDHITGGQVEHVKGNLPEDIRSLWP